MKYSEFKKIVKPVADECGATDDQLQDIYTSLEGDRIIQAGIDGAKAGEALRNILLKLKDK